MHLQCTVTLEEEGDLVPCCIVEEPRAHWAKGNKPDIEGLILEDSTYLRYLKQSDTRNRKQSQSCQGPKGKGKLSDGYRVQFGEMQRFWKSVPQQCECT